MDKLEEMLEGLRKEYKEAHKKLTDETKDIYLDCGYMEYVERVMVLKAKIEVLEELEEKLED